MRKAFMLGIIAAGLVLALAKLSAAAPEPEGTQVSMSSMTVAELEKAGDTARQQKDYKTAIRYFQEALRQDPKNATLYNKIGMAELRSGSLSRARADFERAARLDPKSADAVNNIGAVDYMNKKYGPAAKYFKKAVALQETKATYHVNLGGAWFGQGKVDRAIAEYTRALELDPNILNQDSRVGIVAQVPTLEERARYSYMLAKVYAKRGDVDNCLQCLRKAKEEGYRNLASVYKEEDFSKMWQDTRLHEVVPPPGK